MNKYNIFFASSDNLRKEREEFQKDFNQLNSHFFKRNVQLELVMWEFVDAAVDPLGKQHSYNQKLEECDLLILVYWHELGKFSNGEYRLALELFQKKGTPRIYIYKKTAPLPPGYTPKDANVANLRDLEAELGKEGEEHWPWRFEDYPKMWVKFWEDLINLFWDPAYPHFSYGDLHPPFWFRTIKRDITLFGRDEEIGKISEDLYHKDIGLITLLGPGGSGKSILALAIAGEHKTKFENGAVFIELAPLREAAMIVPTIISTLKKEETKLSLDTQKDLIDYLKDKKLILILDNCEYLIDPCRAIIGEIIQECRWIKIIATTQIAFNTRYERVIHLGSLERPEPSMPDKKLKENPCIQLFLKEAENVQPGFRLSAHTREAVIHICNYRGGIPLGIILAASALRLKSVEEIESSIGESLKIPGEINKTITERHQTVDKAIEWSYNLLNEEQKEGYTRLSIFSDDFTEEAASYVSGAGEHLIELIDSSIIARSTSHFFHSRTFFILEPIRLFGYKRLQASSAYERTRQRFVEYYTAKTSAFLSFFFMKGKDQKEQLKKLEEQYNNIIEAINLARTLQDKASAARITSSLWRFWEVTTRYTQGISRIETILEEPPDDPEIYLELLHGVSTLYYRAGDIPATVTLSNRHLEVARQYEQFEFGRMNAAQAQNNLANVYAGREFDKAIQLYESSYLIFQEFHNKRMMAVIQNNLGTAHSNKGDLERSLDHYSKSRKEFEGENNLWESGFPIYGSGTVYYQLGNFAEARRLFTLAYERRKDAGDKGNMGKCQNHLALICLKEKKANEAFKYIQESYALLFAAKALVGLRELFLTLIQYCCQVEFHQMAIGVLSYSDAQCCSDVRARKKYLEDGPATGIEAIRAHTTPALFKEWMEWGKTLEPSVIFSEIKKFNKKKK